MKRQLSKALIFLLLCLTFTSCSIFEKEVVKNEKSLFDRLGGTYNIAVVVDDFINRVNVNDVLNANPAIDTARKRILTPGLKFQVTTLVSQVTGGPHHYFGRTMEVAHAHLNINENEWRAMMNDFKKSLDKYEVPKKEQQELFDIMESQKSTIVKKD
ncbi:MAG: group 1 truncated hemoglobin [Lentisphaeraceae bacterium]|nr:group 1 truncated hemoglobin [Lentisphaeraceae bacterium]